MQSRLPYYLAVAIVSGLSLTFAAVVESAALYPSSNIEKAHAEKLVADLLETGRFEYFPGQFQNQAKDIEPLPSQF